MNISAQVLSFMLDAVAEGVYHTDVQRRIVHWNASAHRITGHSSASVISTRCQDRVVRHVDGQGRELCSTAECPLVVPLRTGRPHEAQLFLHHQEGHLVPVAVRSLPFLDDQGETVGLTLLFREQVPVKGPEVVEEWKRAARTDVLTGLGNRRAFRQAWTRVHRAFVAKGAPFGILMVDVDHFKRVNDNHGHLVGDRVLKMVAKTLVAAVREKDIVVRWGGEEFLLLLPTAEGSILSDLAERIRRLVERAWISIPNGHLSVTVSVGGAMVRGTDRPEDLVTRADTRLFECKAAGRNRSLTGD